MWLDYTYPHQNTTEALRDCTFLIKMIPDLEMPNQKIEPFIPDWKSILCPNQLIDLYWVSFWSVGQWTHVAQKMHSDQQGKYLWRDQCVKLWETFHSCIFLSLFCTVMAGYGMEPLYLSIWWLHSSIILHVLIHPGRIDEHISWTHMTSILDNQPHF